MKTLKSLAALLFALLLSLSLWACSAPAEQPQTQSRPKQTVQETLEGTSEAPLTGLWKDATYTKDTSFGEGSKSLTVEVKAQEHSITFTLKTDAETVGAALLEQGLIDGEPGAYGLYVKKVNGITADYDVDQSYWAFYIGDEMAMTGVDGTAITEGARYQLVYTK